MLYKGRLAIKQYIKSYRAQFGIKYFPGADTPVGEWAEDVNGVDNLSVSEKVVVELLKRNDFLEEGRQITMDSWFCSVHLAESSIVSTIRSDRGVPQSLQFFKMKAIDTEFARKDDVVLIKFVDEHDVYVLSTVHLARFVAKCHQLRGGREIKFFKTTVIEDYNNTMDGTDKTDAMQHAVYCVRKSYIWHKNWAYIFCSDYVS